jgi:hypothetical protein
MPEFVLNDFNVNITMDTSGTFDVLDPAISAYDANTANLQINKNDWASCFKIKGDGIDVTDVSSTDIQYYVYNTSNVAGLTASLYSNVSGIAGDTQLVDGNPSMTNVENGSGEHTAITANSPNPQLECDFIRHIAVGLFNTANGVDLFNNEIELRRSIETACGTGGSNLIAQISNKLTVAEGRGAMLYNTDASVNFTHTLLGQLLNKAPERFDASYGLLNPTTASELPWQVGDVIQYILTVHAAEGQEDLVQTTAVESRRYKINMILTADPA